MTVILLLQRDYRFSDDSPASAYSNQANFADRDSLGISDLGPRHQLNYEQWLNLLAKEAQVAAQKKPERLTILAGDSLSLWFSPNMLPSGRIWLNQGISGETSTGLLKRLSLFDDTQPQIIFVMIGINDLIRGTSEEIILQNHRDIIRYLRSVHPQSQIVIQSILPHSGDRATWEGRDRLRHIPNSRIRDFNRQLAAIADREGVYYLDLHPLFSDSKGQMQAELTTDGLHLNPKGYLVWRSALQIFIQLKML